MIKELTIEAKIENLQDVLAFAESVFESVDMPMKPMIQLNIAVEEIFVNVASYSYPDSTGDVTIKLDSEEVPGRMLVTFTDSGIPYDPLAKEDPDTTLSLEERGVGGLGIFMVKKSMDAMRYCYENNCNILTIEKTYA